MNDANRTLGRTMGDVWRFGLRVFGLGGLVASLLGAEPGTESALSSSGAAGSETSLWESAGPGGRRGVSTDSAPVHPTSPDQQEWTASWRGWDGLHLELRRRTLLGRWIPGVTNLPSLRLDGNEDLLGRPLFIPAGQDDPLRLRLDETRLTAKIGVKLALDAAAFLEDEGQAGFDNGIKVRRARLYARGDCLLVLPVSYEVEVGYIPDQFYIENSYLKFRNLGFLGTLKVGQYQAPMSLANSGSSRDQTFMEVGAPIQAMVPGVEAGFEVGGPVVGDRMTWALGLFTDGVKNDFGDASEDFGRVIGRITGLAIDRHDPKEPDAQQLLHLGVSGFGLYASSDSIRYRSRPESHLAPFVIDTGPIDAAAASVLGTEAAWVQGPLCLQAEYVHAWVRGNDAPPVAFQGMYASATWFLTGESRPYDRGQGTFARVIPHRPFAPGTRGWGAWEIAARFSHTDLNSGDVNGGRLILGMVGLNGYLHSHLKWRFNYGRGRVDGGVADGVVHLFQTRLEVDF